MGINWIEFEEMPVSQALNDRDLLVWFLIGVKLDLYFSLCVLLFSVV